MLIVHEATFFWDTLKEINKMKIIKNNGKEEN